MSFLRKSAPAPVRPPASRSRAGQHVTLPDGRTVRIAGVIETDGKGAEAVYDDGGKTAYVPLSDTRGAR